LDPTVLTKTGIMVGLGETRDEIMAVMRDVAAIGVDILTVGQYLRPTEAHLPIERYYAPEEFDRLRDDGLSLGLRWVESGPLVRSSYHAEQQVARLSARSPHLARPAADDPGPASTPTPAHVPGAPRAS